MSDLSNFDELWDYEQPAETERQFRDLLPAAEAGGDPAYHIELLTQIARTQGLQRQFDEAHRTLDTAEQLLDSGDYSRARLRYWLERGRVFNSSKNPAQARPLFLEAWKLGQQNHEDFYAVDAAHMLGIIEPPDQQLDWNLKAVALAEKSADPRANRWLGSLYNNIGWTYHDAGKYADALDIFQKALAWQQAHGKPPQIRIARWCIARTLRSLNRVQEAFDLQLALLDEFQGHDGYVYEELGECALLLGKSEAAGYFAQAYAALSQDPWLAANEPARLERLKTMGNAP